MPERRGRFRLYPAALKEAQRWVVVDKQRRPYQARHPSRLAKANNPKTWATYAEAKAAQIAGKFFGVAFIFGDGWIGIDVDACRDPETGRLTDWCQVIFDQLAAAYCSVSASGTGLHFVMQGTPPIDGDCPTRKLSDVESYGSKQPEIAFRLRHGMLSLTGRPLPGHHRLGKPGSCDAALAALVRTWFAEQTARTTEPNAVVSVADAELRQLLELCQTAEDRSAADFHLLCELLRRGWLKDDAWLLVASVGKFAEGGRRYFDLTRHNALKSVGLANGYRIKAGVTSYSLAVILERLLELTGDWPRRVSDILFVHVEGSEPDYLRHLAGLFGWLHRVVGRVKWFSCPDCVTKEEFFRELQRTVMAYQGIEKIPHVPPFEDTYYACGRLNSGGGKRLKELIDRFSPATPLDRVLILALFATPLWGGPGGARPMFVVLAAGRGKGKTTLVQLLAQLYGGCLEIRKDESADVITQRLLTPGSIGIRVVFLDNLKTWNFSWAALESLITTPTISGKRLFHGDATRPNRITYVVTVNEASFSTDFAQRSVFARLGEPARSGGWHEVTRRLIDEHRDEILADLTDLLRGPSVELPVYTRWAEWERDVLAKLPGAADAQRLIAERQQEVDVEGQAAVLVEQHVREMLEKRGCNPDTQRIRISSAKLVEWFNQATGRDEQVFNGSKILGQMSSEGQLQRLSKERAHKSKRSFIWTGEAAGNSAVVDFQPKRRPPNV